MKRGMILGLVVSLIFISAGSAFTQSETEQKANTEVKVEPEPQWLWGEAVSVNAPSKSFVVKYLDYETDSDKEATITVDEKTTYENIKTIDELKPQDTISIDYILGADGKNIAKNISVEKAETPQVTKEEAVPEQVKTEGEQKPAAQESKVTSPLQ